VRRLSVAALGLASLLGVAAVAYAAGFVPGTEGCVWRSVDKSAYVRANEAVLRSLPLSPRLRAAHANTWSHAIPASNKCLPFYENAPPYSAYITTYVFVRKPGDAPLGFDASLLDGEWVAQGGVARDKTYSRGSASLNVTTSDEGVLLRVDHRAYAGRG
jgi:hypothetical protein